MRIVREQKKTKLSKLARGNVFEHGESLWMLLDTDGVGGAPFTCARVMHGFVTVFTGGTEVRRVIGAFVEGYSGEAE